MDVYTVYLGVHVMLQTASARAVLCVRQVHYPEQKARVD